jgi:hypothetical protein
MYNYPPAPHDNEYLYDLTIDVDKQWCLNIYQNIKDKEETYDDLKHGSVDHWKVIRLPHFDYADEIMEELGLIGFVEDYRPRFYTLKSNTILEKHVDLGTQCALNFVLSNRAAPVTFEDTENFYYSTALFNTSIPHSVTNGDDDRILFKISIMDKSFEDVRERIKLKQGGNYALLSTRPENQPYRDKYLNTQRIYRKEYKELHTSNLIPTDMIIDCDLFEKEIKQYDHLFQQWGTTHTDLKRYGLGLTKPYVDYGELNPVNYPMDIWNVQNPDKPLIDIDFKIVNEIFLNIESLNPLLDFKDNLARCNILKWGDNARFYPHIDVAIPAHNLRLWGTNDPKNNHFCFWDEEKQDYIEETDVERGRLYLADTSKYHHAYSTGEDVYTFFISLQVNAYDKIKKSIQFAKSYV